MCSVLIEKIPIINKGLFKKVCRIMVQIILHISLIIFFTILNFKKDILASGQFMVVLTGTDCPFGPEAYFLNISNDAIRISKLHIYTDRFVVWQSIPQLVNFTITIVVVVIFRKILRRFFVSF